VATEVYSTDLRMPEMVTQRNSKSGNKESKEYEEFKEATVVGHASRFLNSGSSP
jgi:hypothetical protein